MPRGVPGRRDRVDAGRDCLAVSRRLHAALEKTADTRQAMQDEWQRVQREGRELTEGMESILGRFNPKQIRRRDRVLI